MESQALKQNFLDDEDVKSFATWIAARIRPSEKWSHKYVNRQTGENWSCNGLYEAFETYEWNCTRWDETKIKLERYRQCLRDAVLAKNNDCIFDVCQKILCWGGVLGSATKGNLKYLTENKSRLHVELQCMCKVLASKEDECLNQDDKATNYRMNVGFSKIYSLLGKYCAMYDSRVGAALGLLVRQFCEANDRSKVPEKLQFAAGPHRGNTKRNASNGTLKFPVLQSNNEQYTKQILRASWLLHSVLEDHPEHTWPGSPGENGFHELAAGLFMIGYDLTDAV